MSFEIYFLSFEDIVEIHDRAIAEFGGMPGIKDEGLLRSAIDQPRMTSFGAECYPTLVEKAAALAFSLIKNHSFHDGNKRVGLGALQTFLRINGFEIIASDDEEVDATIKEAVILKVAASEIGREEFVDWLSRYVTIVE